MARIDAEKVLWTKAVILTLLEQPPATKAEATKKLRRLDAALAAKMLVDVLEQQHIDDSIAPFLMFALKTLQLGKERSRLIEILGDAKYSTATRAYAAMILERNSKGAAFMHGTNLDKDVFEYIGSYSMGQLLQMASDKSLAVAVNNFLSESVSAGNAEQVFAMLETQRILMNKPAHAVYRLALKNNQLAPIHDKILGIISKEGFDEGINLLEKYRNEVHPTKAYLA